MTGHDDTLTTTADSDLDFFLPRRSRTTMGLSPMPVDWTVLSDEEAAAELDLLADWVQWVTWRYRLDPRTVPECWPQHGALIEELSALRTAWVQAYASTAAGTAPLDWQQSFAHARHRLADWVAREGCRPGEHRSLR